MYAKYKASRKFVLGAVHYDDRSQRVVRKGVGRKISRGGLTKKSPMPLPGGGNGKKTEK